MTTRTIQRKTKSQPSQDGDGVKISRINDFKGGLDPFLMLDELRSECPDDYIGGFPSHPHRGIQTLTYVLQGGLTHKDHLEHTSTIGVGDAQWMHTGHGMIHSEMPLTDVHGLHAFHALAKPAGPRQAQRRHIQRCKSGRNAAHQSLWK
ncbi:pirin family protein [Marinobacter sp. ELB17]|uniref:pirin family protein n=1 Tax=Marinobacter sp. ELB17 TaxID=270374 RepID=UPI0002D5282B|nr:pirin family protein [Marinobacter sp. ELB17]